MYAIKWCFFKRNLLRAKYPRKQDHQFPRNISPHVFFCFSVCFLVTHINQRYLFLCLIHRWTQDIERCCNPKSGKSLDFEDRISQTPDEFYWFFCLLEEVLGRPNIPNKACNKVLAHLRVSTLYNAIFHLLVVALKRIFSNLSVQERNILRKG